MIFYRPSPSSPWAIEAFGRFWRLSFHAVSIPRATSQILLNVTLIAYMCWLGSLISLSPKQLEERRATAIMQELWAGQPGEPPLSWRRAASGQVNRFGPTRAPTSMQAPSSPRRTMTDTPREEEFPKLGLTESPQSDSAAEPLIVRLVLLLLMTVCSYGVQVLLERQREVAEEAREFALREGQLHAAGRLAAEFAHKIKNPLAIINNAAYSLQKGFKDGDSGAAEQLQIIQEEVERSDRIITQIMGYAQLSEGRESSTSAKNWSARLPRSSLLRQSMTSRSIVTSTPNPRRC